MHPTIANGLIGPSFIGPEGDSFPESSYRYPWQ